MTPRRVAVRAVGWMCVMAPALAFAAEFQGQKPETGSLCDTSTKAFMAEAPQAGGGVFHMMPLQDDIAAIGYGGHKIRMVLPMAPADGLSLRLPLYMFGAENDQDYYLNLMAAVYTQNTLWLALEPQETGPKPAYRMQVFIDMPTDGQPACGALLEHPKELPYDEVPIFLR